MRFTISVPNEHTEYGNANSVGAIQAALNLQAEGKLTAQHINDNFLLHHLAAVANPDNTNVVKLFVGLGADTNLVDKMGNTPSHIILMAESVEDLVFYKAFITLKTRLDMPFGAISDEIFQRYPHVAELMKDQTISRYGELLNDKILQDGGYGDTVEREGRLAKLATRGYGSNYKEFMKAVVMAQGEGAGEALEMSNTAPNPEVLYLAKQIVWAVKSNNTTNLHYIEEHPLCLQAIKLLQSKVIEGQNWTSLQKIANSNSHLAETILGNMEEAARDMSGR